MGEICCIYMITSPSFKIYIGQTVNYKRRINNYKNINVIKHQKRLVNSLRKYGFDNHKFEILCFCKKEELNFWESFYIKLFDSFYGEHGLNSTSGGDSPKMLYIPRTEDWKKKISNSKKGKKREPFSQEWLDNISRSHKGMKKTKEWLDNLKKAAQIRKERNGYIITEEQKDKFRKSYSFFLNSDKGIAFRKKNSEFTTEKFSKPVLQFTKEWIFVEEHPSARKAALKLKISHPNLVNCCNGKSKSAGGYFWKKKEDYNKIE